MVGTRQLFSQDLVKVVQLGSADRIRTEQEMAKSSNLTEQFGFQRVCLS